MTVKSGEGFDHLFVLTNQFASIESSHALLGQKQVNSERERERDVSHGDGDDVVVPTGATVSASHIQTRRGP